VAWPVATTNATTLTLQTVDFFSMQALSGADVSVCRYADRCMPPVVSGTTDGTGNLVLPVPASMVGTELAADSYVQVTSGSTVPLFFFWGYPITQPRVAIGASGQTVFVETAAEARNSAQGIVLDPTRGTLLFVVSDCACVPATGVDVAIDRMDSAVRRFYGTNYDFAATQTGAGGSSFGGFFDVPAGTVNVTATPVSLGKVASRYTVFVEAGAVTQVMMYPTP
jgi:hypothetical protein